MNCPKKLQRNLESSIKRGLFCIKLISIGVVKTTEREKWS